MFSNIAIAHGQYKTRYTIIRRVELDPLDHSAARESLEENIQEPDNYLEDRNQLVSVKALRMLKPIDIHSFAATERSNPKPFSGDKRLDDMIGREFMRRLSFKLSLTNIDAVLRNNNNSKVEYASDNKIFEQYESIVPRLKSSKTSTQRKSWDARQERFFDRYQREQREQDKFIRTACSSIGREPRESIIFKSKNFRETVERRKASETAAKTIQGERSWYVGLRNASQDHNKKPFIFPSGSSTNGLWMRITDGMNKLEEKIRIPMEVNVQPKKDLFRKVAAMRDNQSLKQLIVLIESNARLQAKVLTV